MVMIYSIFSFNQVVAKWFSLQAISDIPGNVENVRKLLSHPAFDLRNPNKVGVSLSLSRCVCETHVDTHTGSYACCTHQLSSTHASNLEVFAQVRLIFCFFCGTGVCSNWWILWVTCEFSC